LALKGTSQWRHPSGKCYTATGH